MFCEGSWIWHERSRDQQEGFRAQQETPEESRRAHRLKQYVYNNEYKNQSDNYK